MFAIERRRKIISLLEEQSSVMVPELGKFFKVTEETIRRDLEKLEKDGLLKRTHGGAVAIENTNIELPIKIREITNIENKKNIAAKVSELIEDGDTIALDSSTTSLQVAKFIKSKKRITVITNAINIVYELSNASDFTVICIGGNLRVKSMSFVGHLAEESIEKYNVDKAIVSCKGIHLEKGVTESNEAEAEVKKSMIEAADKVYLLADSSKFNKISFVNMIKIEEVDTIFTEKKFSDEWEQLLERKNVKTSYC